MSQIDSIKIDFNKVIRKIKPMHAINNPPTVPDDSEGLYAKIKEANIPYARLHDTGNQFGGAHYVDIGNIFPDFDADENDPASYDFAFTDRLLSAMLEIGLKPFYRLGCTYEKDHKIKAYQIYPPSDPHKWARICEHVILHYNEGWADGFHHNIVYWEIWNEPDNEPEMEDNPMWRGRQEEYFELYDVSAKYLKGKFPDLKIGGYASCGFYALSEGAYSKVAGSSSRVEYFLEFFHNFFKYISERNSPLDFFSWHSYAQLKDIVIYAQFVREQLDKYGYKHSESIFNEWNPGPRNRGLDVDAPAIAAIMCALQKQPVDMSMYYSGYMGSTYCGIFSFDRKCVLKAYYAFKAFGELYALGDEVLSESSSEDIYLCAASSKNGKAALIVNVSNDSKEIVLDVPDGITECFATDAEREYESIDISMLVKDGVITLPPYAVWFFRF